MAHESNDFARLKLRDSMFSVDNMYRKVEIIAGEKGMAETLRALAQMKEAHAGQVRKGEAKIPYIVHPLTMACHAYASGIRDDNLIAAILLHDVVEDCQVSLDQLNVNDTVKAAVDLVTKDGIKSTKEYYDAIAENELATMVKLYDRCNNISTMVTGFKDEKIKSYIVETEEYVLPLIKVVKSRYRQYYNQAFLLKYQMLAVIEAYKGML